MNIVSLHTFIAIVETGSLVRASEKMNVTQSTVTARLKILEQDLGQVLLNRHKSGTTLTPAGSKLLRYARVMTGLWRQAQNEAGLPDGMDSLFSFGCHSDLWSEPGKRIFDGILSEQPNMAVSVYQGGVQELQDWMVSGWVDVVLSYTPLARIGQQAHRIALDQLVLYSNRPDSPIAYDPGYVFVDYGEEYRRAHGEAYYDAGTAKISFDSPVRAHEYLLERGGSAYLPSYMVTDDLTERRLFALPRAPVFQRPVFIVSHDMTAQKWPWFADLIKRVSVV